MPTTNPFDEDEPALKTASSFNPFDEESSTNPFDDESPQSKAGSTNPFDDEEDCPKDDEPMQERTDSTNPFDNDDSGGLENGQSSLKRFHDDEKVQVRKKKAPLNPFDNDEESKSRPEAVLPKASPTGSRAASTILTTPPASVAPRPETKESIPAPEPSKQAVKNSAPETPVVSVTKVLTQLLSVPTNRCCADCRSPLVDSSQVYASFSSNLAKMPRPPPMSLGSFEFHHHAFAPPTETPSKTKASASPPPKPTVDPAMAVVHYSGGFGVFLCAACGAAHHHALGAGIATVRYVQGATASWSTEQVLFMKEAGGNARSWAVYEAYIPEAWQRRRPTSKSTSSERELFCRAKYEALAFLTPLGGPLANSAWGHLLGSKKSVEQWDSSEEFRQFDKLSVPASSADSHLDGTAATDELPSRLVDFFCVVGHNGRLSPECISSFPNHKSPEQMAMDTQVLDCYPAPDSYSGMEFPEHVSKFVFPDGCRPKETRMAPSFFNFVLTSSNGARLYGAALHVYDEPMETEELVELINASDYNGDLPKWQRPSEVVFIPKCLVVISHYCFFNVWRRFLLQLYRITLVEAPLPVERYIANFVSEIPLPPQGKIRVKFAFTDDEVCSISRPASNQLPLADFSYLPLFSSLSVENIMVVMGCLMSEVQVALLCQNYAMLGPVAEALVSLLFPFEWEGIYIPIMPYSMLDILDAPIPYLVGLHSRYLTEMKPEFRPSGVVLVDIDNDIVHLGVDPETSAPRRTPCLPEREAIKLKAKLQQYGSMAYMSAVRNSSAKARMTTGNGVTVANVEREPYAQPSSFYSPGSSNARLVALAKTDQAYSYDDIVTPVSGFLSENGHMTGYEPSQSMPTKSQKMKRLFRKKKPNASGNSSSGDDLLEKKIDTCLLDSNGPEGFSTADIRESWLRFFVSIFKNYESFLVRGNTQGGNNFNQEAFLNDLDFGGPAVQFMAKVTSSQMFQRFIEDRVSNPSDPAVRFFDESILAKHNRSKVTTLTSGGKRDTPFLDSKSGEILESFIPAPPSNWGLPDDGIRYRYGAFPKLDPGRFGKVRTPKQWPQNRIKVIRHTTSFLAKQQEIFAKAMKPLSPVSNMAKKVTRDVEWAVVALSARSRNSLRQVISPQQKDRRKRIANNGEGTTKPASVKANDLRIAAELVLSARRKQGVLIEIAIKIQALCRMHIDRTHYVKLKRAVVCLQRRYRVLSGLTQDPDAVRKRCGVMLLQRVSRGYIARKRAAHLSKCLVLMQRWVRGVLIRIYLKRLKRAAIMAQSIVRGRRVRFAFLILRNLLCKAQASVRGWLTRMRLQKLLERRMSLYRPQMVGLWQLCHSPLSFRTKFWPLTKVTGFLHVRLAEEELERLWRELGIDFERSLPEDSSTDKLSNKIDNRPYLRCLMVQSTLSANGQEGETLPTVLLENSSTDSEHNVHVKHASERLQLEKLQMYEKLNSWKDKSQLLSFYSAFGISPNEKEKKARLIREIWGSYDVADTSASLIMSLFPELQTSKDIHFAKPSKKGQRRLCKGHPELTPLDESLNIQAKVDNRIKNNMREFATARLHSNQMKEKKLSEKFCRQKEAAMAVRVNKTWLSCQHDLILVLLYSNGSDAQGVSL